MKDKIYKTHHKKWYYSFRNTAILSLVILSGVMTFVIPTYISLKNSEIERLKAQEDEEEEEENSTSTENYLTYA